MSNGVPATEVRARPDVAPLAPVATGQPLGLARAAWEHWKKIAHAVGVVQTRLLMVVFYFIFVVPLGLVMRLRGDPLHLKRHPGGNWTPHKHEPPGLDTARRQF